MRSLWVVLVVSLVSGCDGAVITEPGGTAEPSTPTAAVEVATDEAVAPSELAAGATGSDVVAPAGTGMAALDALPWEERIGLEQALAASDARYAPRMDETGPVLETPGSVVATFTSSGAQLWFGGREATLAVVAVGRDGAMRPTSLVESAEVHGVEVRTARGAGITEWWRSLPSGLEHGVTIATRPSGEGELWVEVAVSGELSAHGISDDAVELRDGAGVHVATYAQLVVLDAGGDRVPARMTMDGARIALVIEDGEARYPLVVDPLVTAQEATLVAPDGALNDWCGFSVALSSDGTRALVGAPLDDTARGIDAGSARVFLRMGTTWAQETTLVTPNASAGDNLGYSVALSSDGSVALAGSPLDDLPGAIDRGAAYVFRRTGTTWVQEATLLGVFGGGAANDNFGYSVALTSDGRRALVGAPLDDTARGSNAGSIHTFVYAGLWGEEAMLLAPDGAADDNFGHSVALSSDGSRALAGAYQDDTAGGSNAGSAHVFLRTSTVWAHEATLLAPDGSAGDIVGSSVALTSDGSRALVGADLDDTASGSDAGSARVFLRTGTAWAQEATLLAPDAAVGGDQFGSSVALTSDGSRALVGAYQDDTAGGSDAGSARVFVRTGTAWAQEATLLAPDGAMSDSFGFSVALTPDGSRALVGVRFDDTAGDVDAGSARVFTIALAPNGSTCGGDAACLSGFCTDGVCCGTRCPGGTNDCQACSAALTGGAGGICAALSAAVAPTVPCRASTDLCDAAETCRSTSTVCPADTLATASTVCRAAATTCDVAETCTGTSPACPADVIAAAGTTCRAPSPGSCEVAASCTGASTTCPANGPALVGTICRAAATACDRAETCDGTTTTCATDTPAPGGTTCRASVGICDTAELCDGASFACPGDVLLPSGSVCRVSAGLCDLAETCSGASPDCPGDVLAAPGLVCRPPAPGGCDLAETCTGLLAACPGDLFAPSTTTCGAAVSGVCDAPDHCTGTSGDCEAVFLEGVECRAAAGACDSVERCGSSPDCPADDLVSAGLSCRASTDTSCDPEEMCDGTSIVCPADVTTCMGRPDVGPMADAPTPDAGPPPPPPTTGCACGVGSPRPPALPMAISVLLLGLMLHRLRAR